MPETARSWSALGCRVDVLVADGHGLDAACAAVERVLDAVDLALSRFRPDSEISRLNADPSTSVRVGPILATAIAAGLRAAELTDGAVDLTVGRALRRIGYDRDFSLLQDAGPITVVVEAVPGWHTVRFDATGRVVGRPTGVEIDLGSVGKALAADLAAAAAHAAIGGGVLVSLGGDLATAGAAPQEGWPIGIADDSRADPRDADEAIAIRSGAVATSSTTVRQWFRAGVAAHHLIDPATSQPVRSPWRTVTVVAGTCVDANTAATAAIIRGDDAPAWLDAIGLPARLVATDGTVRRVGAWPARVAA